MDRKTSISHTQSESDFTILVQLSDTGSTIRISGREVELDDDDRNLLEAFFKALRMRWVKKQDYNAGGVSFIDYFPFGRTSAAHMLYTKALRLVSLVSKKKEPMNEPVEDTYIDLMVYAAMSYAFEKRDGQPDTKADRPPDPAVVEGRRGPRQLGEYDS